MAQWATMATEAEGGVGRGVGHEAAAAQAILVVARVRLVDLQPAQNR